MPATAIVSGTLRKLRRKPGRHLAGVGLSLLLGCPQAPSGRYVLDRVNGAELPAGIEGGLGDTLWVYEGSLEFRGGDSVLRAERTAGWRQVDSGRTWLWHYQKRGDSLSLVFDCAPQTICPGPESGILSQDSLVLRSSRLGGATLRYRRIPRGS